jgi:hypothetical protein
MEKVWPIECRQVWAESIPGLRQFPPPDEQEYELCSGLIGDLQHHVGSWAIIKCGHHARPYRTIQATLYRMMGYADGFADCVGRRVRTTGHQYAGSFNPTCGPVCERVSASNCASYSSPTRISMTCRGAAMGSNRDQRPAHTTIFWCGQGIDCIRSVSSNRCTRWCARQVQRASQIVPTVWPAQALLGHVG